MPSMIRGIIFDFNRTLYDPETGMLTEGALDLLEHLKAKVYKMCLISKKTTSDRREQISRLGLDGYFLDVQVLDEDAKTAKSFERCSEVMALQASEIAVVGDRVRSEIALGNDLGMMTFWYRAGKFASEAPRNSREIPGNTIWRLEKLKDYF